MTEATCPLCNATTESKSKLSYHLNQHHHGLGQREKSILMQKARKDAGWPDSKQWRYGDNKDDR